MALDGDCSGVIVPAMNTPSRAVANCATPAARQQTQVECYTHQLAAEIEALDKAITQLAERINPVLRCESASLANDKAAPPEEVLVMAAENLRTSAKRIMGLRRAVESLTDRVEA